MSPDQILRIVTFTIVAIQLTVTSIFYLLGRDRVYLYYIIYILSITLYAFGKILMDHHANLFLCNDCVDSFLKVLMGLAYFNFLNFMIFSNNPIPDKLQSFMDYLFKITSASAVISLVFVFFNNKVAIDLTTGLLYFLGALSFYSLFRLFRNPQPTQIYFISAGSLILIFSFLVTEILVLVLPSYLNLVNKLHFTFTQIATMLEMLLFMIGLQFRFHQNNKQNNLFQKQVLTLEIESLKTKDELLRSKLNPHFIQNIFNILYLNVPVGDSFQHMREYIQQVAAFFRKTLTTSANVVHSLEEELEFIEEYLKLQQLITKHVFRYEIIIDPAIDTYSLEVPTMLLQPMVENSIKHGFSNLTYPGMITIRAFLENNNPTITVEDNGYGDPNTTPTKGRFGLSLTHKRLQYLQSLGLASTIEMYNHPNNRGYITKINFKMHE